MQRAGIFNKYSVVVGAACTPFATNCLYAPFDHVATQFYWWVWNNRVPSGHPTIGVVPMLSTQVFNVAMPFAFALFARLLCRPPDHRPLIIARNVIVIAVLTWPVTLLVVAPSVLLSMAGVPLDTARAVTLWSELTLLAVISMVAFVGALRARRAGPGTLDILDAGVADERAPLWCAAASLVLVAVFWSAALPDYLAAQHGHTASGAPVSSLTYAIVTYALGAAIVVMTYGWPLRTEQRAVQSGDQDLHGRGHVAVG
ncbi:hypothetical protein [Mycobacterium sp. 94-17]|uniref:hypothetical protein n=1 Tax=Mycobacterium sp. 94-17 TaxID=2986147 RepID=UPI002D1ED5F0|nr:hypothetical protein [Mycobacterium sp. 94-17]MEB4209547.1 hypothetical protein [Mycobacterium sp. 94-17]